jgi:hypothetical protein
MLNKGFYIITGKEEKKKSENVCSIEFEATSSSSNSCPGLPDFLDTVFQNGGGGIPNYHKIAK